MSKKRATISLSHSGTPRNGRTHNTSDNSQTHLNNSSDNSDNDNEEASVSISSRGRVRKITAKARGLFKE